MDRFNNVAVNWANRNCNKVADFLSNYAISNEGHLVFGMDYPTVIHNLVIDDVILLKVDRLGLFVKKKRNVALQRATGRNEFLLQDFGKFFS